MTGIRDALVIGGGPAGSALAGALAGAGRDVALIERQGGPHDKVCGEFLSHEALLYLTILGLEARSLGAVPIEAVGIAGPKEMSAAALPFPALSVSRRRLDEALLQRAGRAGAQIRRGASVRGLRKDGAIWTAELAGGEVVRARDAFLATGKHDLRGWKRPQAAQNDLVGLKLHFRLAAEQAAELGRRVELVLFRGGYGGLEPIEDGLANLCLLVRKSRFAEVGHEWDALLREIGASCPHLARRLRRAEPVQNRPLAVASIPYGYVRQGTSGCWHLGDQAAVIPSFAGEGMSIALHSAWLASRCYLAGGSAPAFQKRLAADVSGQIRRATLLSRLLVQGWTQSALAGGAGLVPSALAIIASATRIPTPALLR